MVSVTEMWSPLLGGKEPVELFYEGRRHFPKVSMGQPTFRIHFPSIDFNNDLGVFGLVIVHGIEVIYI